MTETLAYTERVEHIKQVHAAIKELNGLLGNFNGSCVYHAQSSVDSGAILALAQSLGRVTRKLPYGNIVEAPYPTESAMRRGGLARQLYPEETIEETVAREAEVIEQELAKQQASEQVAEGQNSARRERVQLAKFDLADLDL